MKPDDDVEAWADALLDEHRTHPRAGAGPRSATPEQLVRLGTLRRKMMSVDGAVPDAEQVDRVLRAGDRHRRWETAEAVVTIAGVLLALVVVIATFGTF